MPTAFAFSFANFSLENQVENYRLLVSSTSESDLNYTYMD